MWIYVLNIYVAIIIIKPFSAVYCMVFSSYDHILVDLTGVVN